MTRLTRTNQLTQLLRLLVVVGCVLPFAGPRALAAASSLAQLSAPVAPSNEEDEGEREESDGKRVADPRLDRRPDHSPPTADRLHRPHVHQHSIPAPQSRSGPAFDDPFCNGLGSPYRC